MSENGSNGAPSVCIVPECGRPHHARFLCGEHYQQWRRTGEVPVPVVREDRARERWIRAELGAGSVPDWVSATGSMFENDLERWDAWEERREELMAGCLRPPIRPGCRPSAWWRLEAGRPHHLTPYPLHFGGTVAERADAIDHHYIEPLVWMATHGLLTDAELEKLEADATESRVRVGTGSERIGSGGVDRGDRRKVKMWAAVAEARTRSGVG